MLFVQRSQKSILNIPLVILCFMKKVISPKYQHLLFLFIVAFISSSHIYNEDYSKLQKLNLFKENKVWMVYGWTFSYVNGVQEKKGRKTSFERFDRNGNRTEEIFYDKKGNPSYSCQYLYDENGKEIKRVGGASEEVIYEKWNYSVSEDGKKLEKKSEYKKLKDQKWVYTFDEHQNKIQEICFDMNGNISYKWDFLYDFNQFLAEKLEYDPYGNVYQKWRYKYDEKGNNNELLYYVSGDQLYRTYGMRYDKKGNMKSKFTFDKNENVLELTVFVYQFYDGVHAPRALGNKK